MSINWKKKYRRNKHPRWGVEKGGSLHSSTAAAAATVPGPHMGNYLVLWHNWDWEFASHTLLHTLTGTYLGPHLLRVPQTDITIDLRVHYLLDQSRPGEQAGSGWMRGSPGLWSWQKLFIELHAISTGSPPKCQTGDRAVDCTARKTGLGLNC